MIDISQLARRVKSLIDSQTPFMAYWHPCRCVVLRTSPVEQTEMVEVSEAQKKQRRTELC